MRRSSMPMRVMHVGDMWVRMAQPFMPMHVGMRFAGRITECVLMLMMRVMDVAMLMLHRLVHVCVLMMF